MTETQKKALALLNEVRKERGRAPYSLVMVEEDFLFIAIERAIEQHEAFRQEVSDELSRLFDDCEEHIPIASKPKLRSFIIAKPDPLVEAREEAKTRGVTAACIHERPTSEELRLMKSAAYFVLERFEQALAARGLKIVEDK